MNDAATGQIAREGSARVRRFVLAVYGFFSLPWTVVFLFYGNPRIRPEYRMTWARRFRLAWRMSRNTRRVATGTTYKAHLAMAVKLLEIPREVEGAVVECGCYLGGSTANLSLVCDIVGRDLIVYDSFEGLPEAEPTDQFARPEIRGAFRAELDTVKANVARLGVIERCKFRKGWFRDTLPAHTEPVVLCFLDVDFQASLHTCVLNLWPHLTEKGWMFVDEFVLTDYCALFYSERWWKKYFDRTPPGLVGAGTGVGVGQYYLGPFWEWLAIWGETTIAYTRKDLSGFWGYEPSEPEPPRPPPSPSAADGRRGT